MKGSSILRGINGLVLFLFLNQTFALADVSNRIVAKVNNDVITLHELNEKIKQLTGAEPNDLMKQNKEKYLETRRQILELLINQKITQDKINELGILVTSKEIDETIESIKKENNITHDQLIASLRKDGMTYDSFRENIKTQIERSRLLDYEIKSKIIITEEQLRKYYDEHLGQFRGGEKVRLATIILRPKDPQNKNEVRSLHNKMNEIISRLKNGEDFADLARRYSQGPGAKEGGDLGFIHISQLNPQLKNLIESMTPGDISGPISIGPYVQIFKLIEISGDQTRSFDEAKPAILRILYREEVNKKFSSWLEELKEKSYTTVIF